VAKIGGVDIGTVVDVSQSLIRRKVRRPLAGSLVSVLQDLVSTEKRWIMNSELYSPTQSTLESVLGLADGSVLLVEIPENTRLRAGFGSITKPAEDLHDREADIHYITLEVQEVPGVGFAYTQTPDVYFHDRDYRMNLREFNPFWGHHNTQIDENRLVFTQEFYLDNRKSQAQDAVYEICAGDNLTGFKLYGWKTDWTLIGDWGGADSWGAAKTFTDNDSVEHAVTAAKGERGDTVTGGTISWKMGCPRDRVLVKFDDLEASSAYKHTTRYVRDQVLLKAEIIHTLRETARPGPIIDFVDGGMNQGVA